jgi:hypothetical protein
MLAFLRFVDSTLYCYAASGGGAPSQQGERDNNQDAHYCSALIKDWFIHGLILSVGYII